MQETARTAENEQRRRDRRVSAPEEQGPAWTAEEVYRLTQQAAYYKAEARGFAPGQELDDWLEAEAEIRRVTSHGKFPAT
jgi:hypothetical protein